jgi:hypothetical protein
MTATVPALSSSANTDMTECFTLPALDFDFAIDVEL